MATINGSTNNSQWTFKLEVTEGNYDITNNTSPVTVTMYLGRASSQSYVGGNWTGNITIDGSSYDLSGNIPYPTYINGGEWYEVASYSKTVKHNNDGSKNVSVSASMSSSYFTPSYSSASGTVSLATIPRASGVACSSPYIGDNAIISIDKKSSSFTNTLTYKIGTLTGTIVTKTSETTVQFQTSEIADSIYALIPNDTEISGTIYCTTYNGSTQIGDTQSTSFNLYAKESMCKPRVRAVVSDSNNEVTAVTGSTTKFIKYISKPTVNVIAESRKSSEIKKFSINLNDGQTASSSEKSGTSGQNEVFWQKQFSTIGSNKVSVSATDSRGYPNSSDTTLDMIDYIKLHINTISITRPEGTSNEAILNCNGAYYNGSFTDTVPNALSGSFKYRKSGETDWTDGGSITPTITNSTFRFNDLSLGNLFDYNEEYQFKVILKDKFLTVGSSDTEIITLPKGQETIAVGDKEFWLYGTAYLNDETIGINKNSANSSTTNGYSCNYLNDKLDEINLDIVKTKNISYCKMNTNFETKEITNPVQITGWENWQENGDLGAYPSRNRLEIKNTTLAVIMGKTCGQYGMSAYLELRDSNNNLVLGNNQQSHTLAQPSGNNFWSESLPPTLVVLDPAKTYYVTLWANSYDSGIVGTAYMNNGFGKNGTWMAAIKLM